MSSRPPLMPSDTPDWAAGAWLGCLRFHAGKPEFLDAFRTETGNTYQPALDPLGRAIDQATGRDEAFVEAFVGWFNRRIWGPWDGRVGQA